MANPRIFLDQPVLTFNKCILARVCVCVCICVCKCVFVLFVPGFSPLFRGWRLWCLLIHDDWLTAGYFQIWAPALVLLMAPGLRFVFLSPIFGPNFSCFSTTKHIFTKTYNKPTLLFIVHTPSNVSFCDSTSFVVPHFLSHFGRKVKAYCKIMTQLD